jgi:hypothetical protein
MYRFKLDLCQEKNEAREEKESTIKSIPNAGPMGGSGFSKRAVPRIG